MKFFFRPAFLVAIFAASVGFATANTPHEVVDDQDHNHSHGTNTSHVVEHSTPADHPSMNDLLNAHTAYAGDHDAGQEESTGKPSPDEVLKMLQEGNVRFFTGRPTYPHLDPGRLFQAGTENQGDHAYATVISCSDSRVPVELIFDAGIMDLFVIRVAGNVCDTDEIGSIEYGLAHVNTPVLVVLGHTQCGAVTAVTHEVQGRGHKLEKNIPPLVDNIVPAVKRAMHKHPELAGDAIIPDAIEENVWQGIRDLLSRSPDSLRIVNEGKAKIVGAIYDVSTGQVVWLPQEPVDEIISEMNHSDSRVDAHSDVPHEKKEEVVHSHPAATEEQVYEVESVEEVEEKVTEEDSNTQDAKTEDETEKTKSESESKVKNREERFRKLRG